MGGDNISVMAAAIIVTRIPGYRKNEVTYNTDPYLIS